MRRHLAGYRFETTLTVIDGGSGVVRGEITETDQSSIPSYQFVLPRLILRSRVPNAIRSGLILRSESGNIYITAEHGPSDQVEGTLWDSWRLMHATGQYSWERRVKAIDPVTRLPADTGLQDMGLAWCAMEPMDREQSDYRMAVNHEQVRFATNKDVLHDDILDGKKVVKADKILGITVGFVQ